MNEENRAEQFAQEVDAMLLKTSRVENHPLPEKVDGMMDIVQVLTVADFSGDSQVRQTLKKQLRNAHLGQRGYQMNMQISQRSVARFAMAILGVALLSLAISPLGVSFAQTVVERIQDWQLGENTTAVNVDGDFEAVLNDNGETVILPLPEQAEASEDETQEEAFEGERQITLDPTISPDVADAELAFVLRYPTFIPEGYESHGIVATYTRQASLEYVNTAENRLIVLLQTAVGGDYGNVQVTFSSDMVAVETTVAGHEALWTQAGDEGLLVWEADGVNYQLMGVTDLDVALQIAESLE